MLWCPNPMSAAQHSRGFEMLRASEIHMKLPSQHEEHYRGIKIKHLMDLDGAF